MSKKTIKEINQIIAKEKKDLASRKLIVEILDFWPLTIIVPAMLILILFGNIFGWGGQMYNTILYIGTFLMIGGFSLFLYFEMKERQLDREAFMNQQLTKSFNKAKEEEVK